MDPQPDAFQAALYRQLVTNLGFVTLPRQRVSLHCKRQQCKIEHL